MRQLAAFSVDELERFGAQTQTRSFGRNELLLRPGQVPNEMFFVNQGLLRVVIADAHGTEHTIHFAMEHQFITDYSAFIARRPAQYSLQALEDTEVVAIPRSAIEWGYDSLAEGEKLGRKIAESYFMYQDERIKNAYVRTPKERYDELNHVFPNIQQRAPQYLIASYLGITPIHLSRLKHAK